MTNLYVDWLRQEHADSLSNGLVSDEQVDTSVTMHPSTMANNLEQQEEAAEQKGDNYYNKHFTGK